MSSNFLVRGTPINQIFQSGGSSFPSTYIPPPGPFSTPDGTVSKQNNCGYQYQGTDLGPQFSAHYVEISGNYGDGGPPPGSPGGTPEGGGHGNNGVDVTYTCTIPSWCTQIGVLLIGSGGGGGGGGQTSQSGEAGGSGGGGGGGGFSLSLNNSSSVVFPFTPGETTITIVAGGGGGGGQGGYFNGGSWKGSAGSTGNPSYFSFQNYSNVLLAFGGYHGTGGQDYPGGGGDTNNGTQGAGGDGYIANGNPAQDTPYVTTGGTSGYTTNGGEYPSGISSSWGLGGNGGGGGGPGGGSSASPGGDGGYARIYFFL